MFRNLLRSTVVFLGIFTAASGAEPAPETQERKPILLVLTNHGALGDTGKATGFFLSEASHPWKVFLDEGYEVVLGSPRGGFSPVDPKSFKLEDEANAAFWKTYGGEQGDVQGVGSTRPLKELNPEDYAGIFFAGGHGAVWDFPDDPEIIRLGSKIHQQGGVVGAVCHGPAALIHLQNEEGTPLVSGKKVAAFTNAEEAAVELTSVVPYLLADALEKSGAIHVPGENFSEKAERDGRLVTGQNPASAKKTAQLMIEALKSKD